MGFAFGWEPNDERESCWPWEACFYDLAPDGSTGNHRVPAAALEAWRVDLDASHVRDYARPGTKPSRITFRGLSTMEAAYVDGQSLSAAGVSGALMAAAAAFALSVDFPDEPPEVTEASGAVHRRRVKVGAFIMLADWFTRAVDKRFGSMISTYGYHVWLASKATEPEKKASSPRPTETPSVTPTASPTATTTSAPAAEAA
jgi:hypothetical protein